MRIAGGEWCGRTLKAPPGDAVRPTQDRVRGALFSMIQAEIAGASFLDLFAGAGSVGLAAAGGQGRAFDIAFADPPYALVAERGYGPLLAALAESGAVRPGGLFVAEMATRQAAEAHPLWELCRDRAYGQTRIAVYRNVCGIGE